MILRRAHGLAEPLCFAFLAAILFASSCCLRGTDAAETTIIALTVTQSTNVTTSATPTANTTVDGGGKFFPMADSLSSVIRLAADDINAGGADFLGLTEGNLTLAIVGVNSGIQAMEGFCEALDDVGENGTFGIIGPMLSSQASLLETISNDFFGLPLVTPSAPAARAETYFSTGTAGLGDESSYLFGLQPDVFLEMEALARLILDMKTERDTNRGWRFNKERVHVLYADDTFGNLAASAFTRAATDVIGVNIDANAAGAEPATIEVVSIAPLTTEDGTDYRSRLLRLVDRDASIIVLLAEGYDAVFVRSVLRQAREVGLSNDGVQWYVSGGSATDGIFTVNETYHESQLAYDFRGALGVRACSPTEGIGFPEITNLTSRWAALNPDEYPGAGVAGLTPDGRMDPLLAFAYDSVFALAGAIGSVQSTARQWGDKLNGFVTDSCPYSTEGLWSDGVYIREAAETTDFTGVTGRVRFDKSTHVVTSGAGEAGSGWRRGNGTTFCALNLKPHASLGATFTTLMSWMPDSWTDVNGTAAYESISPFSKKQTYPSEGDAYPFDRPVLQGLHLEVVGEEAAVPFAMITGRETEPSSYKGIALELMQSLSERLEFTYNVTIVDDSFTSDDVLDMIVAGDFDVVASWTTVNADRMERVSFSFPYYTTGISFVYRHEVVDKVSWWKMFEPFENELWVAILVATVLVFFLLWLFDGSKNDQFARAVPTSSGNRRQTGKGMALTAYVSGAMLLGQMAHEPHTLESFILTMGWIFACFILAASFTAELAAFLSAEKAEDLAFGLDDLRNGAVPHSQVALREGSTLKTFYEEEVMACYTPAQCDEVEFPPTPCRTQDECFELVMNETCRVTVVDSVTASYQIANDYCGLNMLDEIFNSEHYGFAFAKDSPYLDEFRTALLDLEQEGVIADIADTYFDASRCEYLAAFTESSAADTNISLVDMGGVFLVLGLFASVSFSLWLVRRSPWAKRLWARYYERREKRIDFQPEKLSPSPRDKGIKGDKATEVTDDLDEDVDKNVNSWSVISPPSKKWSNPIVEEADPTGQSPWRPFQPRGKLSAIADYDGDEENFQEAEHQPAASSEQLRNRRTGTTS